MFNQLSSKFITKLYSAVFVQLNYKFTVLQFKYLVQTHPLLTSSYSTINPSIEVSEHYRELHEEELNSLLKDPKYKAMYDKYSLEIEYIKYLTDKVPKHITAFNWLYLLQTTTKGERRSYINFLWKLEMKNQHEKEQKLLKQKEKLENSKEDDIYGLHKCSMFHRIRAQTMNDFYNGRLIRSMLYEPTIVIDVSYDNYMSPHEKMACAKQLSLAFALNRSHDSPCNLYLCNVNKNSIIMKTLHKIIPPLYNTEFPLNITSKCYSEMFDKNRLVYLTPHGKTVLKNYNADLIYIIGAIVDKKSHKPLTYQKAKEQGIKMMKLPLSEKLDWGPGSSKNLPLNQVLSIMLDLKYFKNWDKALRIIPRRKLSSKRYTQEQNLKNRGMLKYKTLNLTDKK